MTDDLAALQRAAYGPDSTPVERAAAEAALQARAVPTASATLPEPAAPTQLPEHVEGRGTDDADLPFSVPPVHRTPRFAAAIAALAVAASVAFVGASTIAATPRSSLEIFDRPQAEQDLGFPFATIDLDVIPETTRWIGNLGDDRVAVALEEHGWICSLQASADNSSIGSAGCISPVAFARSGLLLESDGDGQSHTLYWGPEGGSRSYDLSAFELDRRGIEPYPSAELPDFSRDELYDYAVDITGPCLEAREFPVGYIPERGSQETDSRSTGAWFAHIGAMEVANEQGKNFPFTRLMIECPSIYDVER